MVYVCGWVCTTKTPDRNDLKLSTVVSLVVDIASHAAH